MKIKGFANIYDESFGSPFEYSIFIYALPLGAKSASPPFDKSCLIKKAHPIEIDIPDSKEAA